MHDNWNFHEEYKTIQDANYLEMLVDTESLEADCITRETADKLLNLICSFYNNYMCIKYDTYFEILAELYTLDYRSDTVQTLIKKVHEFVNEKSEVNAEMGVQSRYKFAKVILLGFIPSGDLYATNEKRYGAQGCRFIAEAVAYYGGYDRIDDMEDETIE